MEEKVAATVTKIIKAITPVCSHLSGKLKIPVPIAPASKLKIAPLKAPSPRGPKVLLNQDLFGTYSVRAVSVSRDWLYRSVIKNLFIYLKVKGT